MINISSTTPKIDSSTVAYLNGKSSEQIKQAAAVEQPSHPEMVAKVTEFLDGLINLGTEIATGNTEVTKTVREVADDLARHVFTVKELLVEDGSALKKADGSTQFPRKAESTLNDSVNNLAEQAINLVNTKLSAYGINIDNSLANKLQKEIIQQLKKPPEPKSAADNTAAASTAATTTTSTAAPTANPATTTSTSPKDPIIFLIDFLKEKQSELTKGLLGSQSIATFLNQQADKKKGQTSGMSLLRESNQTIKNKIANLNQDQIDSAIDSFDTNLAENTKFIETHLGKDSFNKAFQALSEDKKIQVGILLKNLETTVDENTMVSLTGKITGQLGDRTKKDLLRQLGSLIEQQDQSKESASSSELNMGKANKRLGEYNQALKNIETQHLPTQGMIAKKQEATAEFLENIKGDLANGSLSIDDVKVIQKSIGLTENERRSGKASPAIDNILDRFITPLKEQCEKYGITTEDLKQFAGTTAALAIGAALFCPNLVPGLANGVLRLGTMLTQTIIPIYTNMTQTNITKTLAQTANSSH